MSWNSHTGTSRSGFLSKQPQRGILRSSLKKSGRYQHSRFDKNLVEKDDEELLVFGYSCKIFPLDDHSRDIAKGKHLIPWNGDNNLQLLIDRYDARASLHDLSEFHSDSWNTEYEMSEEEARIEQVCNQERYMAMYTDIAEERIRHEEEIKRLHASIAGEDSFPSFKEVGFNYGLPQPEAPEPNAQTQNVPGISEAVTMDEDNEEKPFMVPAALALPPDMEIPPTEKMHAIIEKTANFVSKNGTQMEIVLKAKQANSSQFLFLDFDHYLNPYYKHILQRFKEGKYRVGMNEENKDEEEEDEESDSDEDGGYLHPSLFASSNKPKAEEEKEKREKFKAILKVDPDHPLAKLIEKGRKANALKQYNIMKSAVQSFNPGKENALEPPPLPKFMESEKNSSASSSPLQDQDALPPRITPQEAAMVIVPPPPDIQPMVDSVAKQIAEEGDTVEQNMRAKNDPLLAFLQPSHELHPYYTFRKTFIREQLKAQKRLQQQLQALQEDQDIEGDSTDKALESAPISFSIKGKKEGTAKSKLLSNRLQALGEISDNTETDEESEPDVEKEVKENTKPEKIDDNPPKPRVERKPTVKRKFAETAEDSLKSSDADTPMTMTEEDRKRLLEQTRNTSTATPNLSSISSFTVVTPDGNTMSIAEFREKQAERRQKAGLLALQKAKESASTLKPEPVVPNNTASQDIFDIFDDDDTTPPQSEGKKSASVLTVITKEDATTVRSAASERDSSPQDKLTRIEEKSPPALPPASTAMTLKDLVVAASRSSTPSSTSAAKEGRRRRSRSKSSLRRSRSRSKHRSHSRSRSRDSSAYAYNRRRNVRSRSRDREHMPSSYKKILGSSGHRSANAGRVRYDDDENIPSAYRIENPPPAYGNGSYSRPRRCRNVSPEHRNHKRHRHDSDKDDYKKKHRTHGSPSQKLKRKHSKSKKKHKKKKSKSKKKKEKGSEEGEWSSDDAGSNLEDVKGAKEKKDSDIPRLAQFEKEEGELTPQDNKDMSKG